MDKEGNAQLYRGHTQSDDAACFSLGCRAPTPDFVIHTYRICGIRMNGKYSYSYRNPCCPILERERTRGREKRCWEDGGMPHTFNKDDQWLCLHDVDPAFEVSSVCISFLLLPFFSARALWRSRRGPQGGLRAPSLSLSLSLHVWPEISGQRSRVFPTASNDLLSTLN